MNISGEKNIDRISLMSAKKLNKLKLASLIWQPLAILTLSFISAGLFMPKAGMMIYE